MPAVSPEALGLAEHVGSIVADMNRNRGITAGGMQLLMLLSGARWKRRKALLQVRPFALPSPGSALLLDGEASSGQHACCQRLAGLMIGRASHAHSPLFQMSCSARNGRQEMISNGQHHKHFVSVI